MSDHQPVRRGPLTAQEERDLRRLLLRPVTLESFAAFGAGQVLSCLDVRNGLGVTLPGAIRRTWWLRVVDLAATLNTLASPDAPAMATPAGRERQVREVERALHAFAAYHGARVAPRVAELPPLTWQRCEALRKPSAGGCVVQFPPPRPLHADGGGEDGRPPLGAA